MKKSLIALAVSSAVVAPASVQAAEVYGAVNTTFESASTDNGGNFAIFNTTGDDAGGGMSDTFETRIGASGSEDLGNGLTAGYTLEFGVGTSSGGAGSVNEDSTVNTRLANVSIGGDFGKVTLGTQWGVLYEYAGWNHYRTDGHGGATHYYMMSSFVGPFNTSLDPSGLRIDNALTYTYGGGGYSSDPFTFSVQVVSKDRNEDAVDINDDGDFNDQVIGNTASGDVEINDTETGTDPDNYADGTQVFASESAGVEDEETIDAVILGAQGTLPMGVTINGTFYSESNTNGAEPSLFTLGGRWSSGPFYVGGTFFQGDNDLQGGGPGDSPSAFNLLGGMDFGSGYSGYVGVGAGDADNNTDQGDLSTYFLQAEKTLSSRTKIYGEFENAEIDGGAGADSESQVVAIGLKHSF